MYKVIKDKKIDNLEKSVIKYMRTGFIPTGNISTIYISGDLYYVQAIYKPKQTVKEKLITAAEKVNESRE